MGYDATCYLPKKIRPSVIGNLLIMLGYQKYSNLTYSFFETKDYLSVSGVLVTIDVSEENTKIYLRSQISATKTDILKFNQTMKELVGKFGGYFHSDCGKGRYITTYESDRKKAEAGCYLAYQSFMNNRARIQLYMQSVTYKGQLPPLGVIPSLDEIHPEIVSNNILIPFIVSMVEDYFRSSYVALLKYSDRKQILFRNARLNADDLYSISEGEITVEDAISQTKSFQNMDKIIQNFLEIDKNLDIGYVLRKPYRHRKQALCDSLQDLFDRRHALIHRHIVIADYVRGKLNTDVDNVNVSIKRVYEHFVTTYKWDATWVGL